MQVPSGGDAPSQQPSPIDLLLAAAVMKDNHQKAMRGKEAAYRSDLPSISPEATPPIQKMEPGTTIYPEDQFLDKRLRDPKNIPMNPAGKGVQRDDNRRSRAQALANGTSKDSA